MGQQTPASGAVNGFQPYALTLSLTVATAKGSVTHAEAKEERCVIGLSYEQAERLGPHVAALHPDAPRPAAGAAPGPWTVDLPDFHPPTVNALMRGHWAKRAALKKAAVARVAAACRAAGVPLATGRRRVAITVAAPNLSRAPDPDNVPKAILDGLKRAGAIVDDRASLCDLAPVAVVKGPRKRTTVVVEDAAEVLAK